MTTFIHIGATAADDFTPCHAMEDWGALLAAMERNDADEILRITTTAKPAYVATASLKPVELRSMKDAAAAFWTKKGKKPKSRATDASGTPIVLTVRT